MSQTRAMIDVRREQEDWVIAPQGDLGPGDAESLRAVLLQLLEKRPAHCRLDLRQAADLDPLILAVLLSFEQTLRAVTPGARITVENAGEDMRALFEATRLTHRFLLAG